MGANPGSATGPRPSSPLPAPCATSYALLPQCCPPSASSSTPPLRRPSSWKPTWSHDAGLAWLRRPRGTAGGRRGEGLLRRRVGPPQTPNTTATFVLCNAEVFSSSRNERHAKDARASRTSPATEAASRIVDEASCQAPARRSSSRPRRSRRGPCSTRSTTATGCSSWMGAGRTPARHGRPILEPGTQLVRGSGLKNRTVWVRTPAGARFSGHGDERARPVLRPSRRRYRLPHEREAPRAMPTPVLRGTRAVLRPFKKSDIEARVRLGQDADINRMFGGVPYLVWRPSN